MGSALVTHLDMQNVLPGCLFLRSLAGSFAVSLAGLPGGLSDSFLPDCQLACWLAGCLSCMLAFHSHYDPKPSESEHLVFALCSSVVLSAMPIPQLKDIMHNDALTAGLHPAVTKRQLRRLRPMRPRRLQYPALHSRTWETLVT